MKGASPGWLPPTRLGSGNAIKVLIKIEGREGMKRSPFLGHGTGNRLWREKAWKLDLGPK